MVAGGQSHDDDGADATEVYAIYVLAQYAGQGVGSSLMAEMGDLLPTAQRTTLWVLSNNQRSIQFYEHLGYRPDGTQKEIKLGGRPLWKIRYHKKTDSS